jgi:hypothetical protein
MRISRPAVQWLVAAAGAGMVAAALLLGRAPAAPPRYAPSVEAPVILGRREHCLVCHAGIEGLDAAHRPESIGCASCHGGDVTSRDAAQAHAGMILVPGNVADAPRTCGQAMCHSAIIPRVERSIMTTMAGVVEVNRRVFGERSSGPPHIGALGATPADTHLRQLCASCHLGQPKTEWGPTGELSRGGGCSACHLVYDSIATRQLADYLTTSAKARTGIPRRHPSFTIAVDNGRCFGCHSRSGRISTNYEGWHELRDAPSAAALAADARSPRPQYRLLDDGRYFTRVTPDVHQARGMDCIDCHTAGEVMGTGAVVAHARDQVQIRCEDCHASRFAAVPPTHADAEAQQLSALRGWTFRAGERLVVAASGTVLANVVVAPDQSARLRHKRAGTWAPLRAPRPVCTQGGGHSRLSCNTCHTAWAPRCATCHTRYDPTADGYDHVDQQDVKGAWQESSGPFEATPPTLGIRATPRDAAHPNGVVDTFVPGMILTIDRNRTAGGAPDSVFRRLYARTFSHTISRASRSCASCHSDPVALGYGRGTLRYEVTGGIGRWRFTPALAPLADNLPADAWTGFLQSRRGMVSTRDDVRPFTAEEQRRILAVGACLTCHEGTSRVMQRAIVDFGATLARRTKRCVVPSWETD